MSDFTVADLRYSISQHKKKACPPTSKLKKQQLLDFVETHNIELIEKNPRKSNLPPVAPYTEVSEPEPQPERKREIKTQPTEKKEKKEKPKPKAKPAPKKEKKKGGPATLKDIMSSLTDSQKRKLKDVSEYMVDSQKGKLIEILKEKYKKGTIDNYIEKLDYETF